MYLGAENSRSSLPSAVLLHGGRYVLLGPPVRRLGVGTQVGEEVGAGITQAAAAAGPAAPVVAAIGGLVSLFSQFFGGGCGAACTQSATLEQVPEVALDDLHAVALQQPGAISAGAFEQAWQGIISYGTAQLQALAAKGDSRAAGGITNLENSTDYSGFLETLPAVATAPLDLNNAQAAFTSPSASGWEPGAVAAGNALALQVLQSIASASPAGGGSSVVSALTAPVAALATATGIPESVLLLGGAWLVGSYLL